MPAVESLLPVAPAVHEAAVDHNPEPFSDSPESGHDFDSVMQATLAPQGRRSHTTHTAKDAVPRQALETAAKSNPSAGNTRKPGDGHPISQTEGNRQTSKAAADSTPPDSKADAMMTNTGEPLPVFLSLPLFLQIPPPTAANGSAPSNPAGRNANGAVGDSCTNVKGANSAAPAPNPGLPSMTQATKAGIIGDRPANSFTLASLRPSTLPNGETQADSGQNAPAMSAGIAPTKGLSDSSPGTGIPLSPIFEPAANMAPATDKTDVPTLKPDSIKPEGNDLNPVDLPTEASQIAANIVAKGAEPPVGLSIAKVAQKAGTGVAISDSLMKNPQKTNKVAGPDVQVLPVGMNREAGEKNLPTQLVVTPVRSAENHGADLNFTFSNGTNQSAAGQSTPALNTVDTPSLADARTRAVDRTHDMIALHTMRLVESKSDVLSVVIKPAIGTELSLEVRQDADGVTAHATMMRGDHQFLSQHWPELQQRLEQRGIKLAPLDGGQPNFSAGGNPQFKQQSSSQEDAAQQASAFAEFATVAGRGNSGGATARLVSAHDGWESWA
jgi:hypothetical protein